MGVTSYAQTTFTQTYIDRCTGDVRVVTANFVNGSATVAFYDKIKIFTYQQYLNGELQAWLIQTYEWWQALSPCSSTTQQTQQAQQTAQNAQQAAQAASSAASSAATAAATTPPPTNTGGTTNGTNNTTNNTSSNNSTSSGGSTEGSSGGTTQETKTEETKTGETKTEEGGGGETKSEEGDSKESGSDDGDGEKSEDKEEVKEEKSKEEKEKEEKKKQRTMNPIQLKADMMNMQNPLGGFNLALNFGLSQSSIYGDVSYGANLMVFDNLKQATLSLNRAKVYMDESYNVEWIESIAINYGNNFGTQSTSGNYMLLKPMGKKGTVGFGVNYSYMFGGMLEKPMGSMGYNLLYTNNYMSPNNRWTYSPAFIISQTPLSFTLDTFSNISNDAMFILANSFTYRITKSFTINFGYTAIKSTNPLIPLINSFMIGSKLPF